MAIEPLPSGKLYNEQALFVIDLDQITNQADFLIIQANPETEDENDDRLNRPLWQTNRICAAFGHRSL